MMDMVPITEHIRTYTKHKLMSTCVLCVARIKLQLSMRNTKILNPENNLNQQDFLTNGHRCKIWLTVMFQALLPGGLGGLSKEKKMNITTSRLGFWV